MQQVDELVHHAPRPFHFPHCEQAFHGKQRVIQEMRVNLRMEEVILGALLLLLAELDVPDQPLDTGDHAVKRRTEHISFFIVIQHRQQCQPVCGHPADALREIGKHIGHTAHPHKSRPPGQQPAEQHDQHTLL